MKVSLAIFLAVVCLPVCSLAQVPAEPPHSAVVPVEQPQITTRETTAERRAVATQAERPSAVATDELGTAGDVLLSGAAPFTTSGVQILPKSGWPDIAVKINGNSSSQHFSVYDSSNSNIFTVRGNGRVGIGNTVPGSRLSIGSTTNGLVPLHVEETLTFDSTTSGQYDIVGRFMATQTVPTGSVNNGWTMGARIHSSLQGAGSGTLSAMYGVYSQVGVLAAGQTNTITNAYGGLFSVQALSGTVTNGYGVFIPDVVATNQYAIYAVGADDKSFLAGRLGIGVGSPTEALDVNGNMKASGSVTAGSFSTAGGVSGGSVTTAGVVTAGSASVAGAVNAGSVTTTGMVTGGTLKATGALTAGSISTTGNLSVNSINATGDITGARVFGAVYQDLAEWVPASEDMTPGTVVVIDPTTNNQVMPSHRSYDTTVAGVVSAQPGVILGVGSPSKEQIATTGRVKVKVDATRGPVAIGDILVTSDRSGMAMKSQPLDLAGIAIHRPGTVIGKALEPLAGGEGEILVLLSLQ
ncbi:MAG TPA: hypothetical protein VGF48_08695 [Thermoanaerobaculia bacterium]|jgi:hypothetical protein